MLQPFEVFRSGRHFVIASEIAYTVFEPNDAGVGSIGCENYAVTVNGLRAARDQCLKLEIEFNERNA